MSTQDSAGLRDAFWKELEAHRTGMLGLSGARDAHSQPMTAHFEGRKGPLWFYARSGSGIVKATDGSSLGVFHYSSRGHHLYACVHGALALDRSQAVIDRFWSEEVARWFPEGSLSPEVTLLRFEPTEAQIWRPTEGPDPSVFYFTHVEAPEDVRAKAAL